MVSFALVYLFALVETETEIGFVCLIFVCSERSSGAKEAIEAQGLWSRPWISLGEDSGDWNYCLICFQESLGLFGFLEKWDLLDLDSSLHYWDL